MGPLEMRAIVEAMIAEGLPFGLIEDWIEQHADGMVANALWLLAWAEADNDTRQAVVDSLLIA